MRYFNERFSRRCRATPADMRAGESRQPKHARGVAFESATASCRHFLAGKMMQVVVPCASRFPLASRMSPSAVAVVRPRWISRPVARIGPVSWVIARTRFTFTSSVV